MSLRISCPAAQSQVNRQASAFKGTVLLNTEKISHKVLDKVITEATSFKNVELRTCGFKNPFGVTFFGISFAESAKKIEQDFVKKVRKIAPQVEHYPKKTIAKFEEMVHDGLKEWPKKLLKKPVKEPVVKSVEKPERIKVAV